MSENIPEKGAVIQKDLETYAIIPYIPGGLVDPATLIKIASIAEKYNAKTLKVTSNQRIAIIGIKFEDIDKIWEDLDMKPGGFIGKRVRSTKFCPGTTYCKRAEQDSIKMGIAIDEKFQGMEMPNKIKIGVSGCPNSCAESVVKDKVTDKLDPLATVHPEDREMVQRLIESRVAGALDRVEYEFRGLRKDGSPITLKVIGGKMVYRGRPAATSTIVDVTREKNLESQLRQSQKMESIGTLAGGIAHDFNNILTAIIGYGSLLQMGMGNDPKRQYVDQLLASSQKAAILTQSLLAFSRKQAMELKPRRINEIVREAQKLLKRLLTEDIEFTVIRADPDITVEADVTQIDQVLMNLATNARDAMPTGGKLTVETKAVHLDKNFIEAHGFDGPGEYALISVTDTGRGMDHEMQEKIFEPFFTTKEMGKGTGLGLSIVYGIVTQHKGYITVSSEPHKGTRFDVYLPVVKVPAEQAKQSHEHIRGGKETILFAEDSNEVRGLASEVLTKKGYTVIEARNGDDAVRQFMEHRDEIALLLFDVVMPEKNGKEAYEEIRRVSPDVKVLFTSGYTGDIVLIKGISDEAINYISKPLTPNELLKKVREVLDKRS